MRKSSSTLTIWRWSISPVGFRYAGPPAGPHGQDRTEEDGNAKKTQDGPQTSRPRGQAGSVQADADHVQDGNKVSSTFRGDFNGSDQALLPFAQLVGLDALPPLPEQLGEVAAVEGQQDEQGGELESHGQPLPLRRA